jgi:curved DNA-binding protein CbpA
MERYYRILGIPNDSSKEIIKKAYYEKIKALHPDKIHGTPLEDTATFFTAEINESYNVLMGQFKEDNASSNQSNRKNFTEEEIYVENKGYLKYTLSNNLSVIINEIYNRMRCTIPDNPSQILWELNPGLSPNVRWSMNKHNQNYSMTSFFENSIEIVIINKRSGSNWYYAGYEIISQPKKQSVNTETYSNSTRYTSCSNKNPYWLFLKCVIILVIFGVIFQQCNSQQSAKSQHQTTNYRVSQVFTTVVSCDWLNVRGTPSSANNNIIEAIRVNTRVEILERTNNGWVKIKYGNSKTGYVDSNYLR